MLGIQPWHLYERQGNGSPPAGRCGSPAVAADRKRVVITGATCGVGLAAAKSIAAAGADLTIVARTGEKARAAISEIARAAGIDPRSVDALVADLSSQAEVRRLAQEIADRYPRLDVLANNAGAIFWRRRQSVDGIELTWAVNHLAPFLLTTLLLDRLKASAPARIVTTSSAAHLKATIRFDDINAERRFRGFRRYGESKLANILFTTELARRLEGTGVTANCFHPGLVATRFNRNNGPLMAVGMVFVDMISRRPEKGGDTLAWLALSPDAAGMSGGYFIDRKLTAPSAAARDADAARRLWTVSERQVGAVPTSAGYAS